MGLFGRRRPEEDQADEAGTRLERIREEIAAKGKELEEVLARTESVRKEYDGIVGNLMAVKRELNEKRISLDIARKEQVSMLERMRSMGRGKDSEIAAEFGRTEEELAKIKKEVEVITGEYDTVQQQLAQDQSRLHIMRKQQVEVEKELDEANSRLYNAKEELDKRSYFEDTSVLSQNEKGTIQADDGRPAVGVIEAASAVVGTLKSRLREVQKDLEDARLMLEKERREHDETRAKLEETREGLESLRS